MPISSGPKKKADYTQGLTTDVRSKMLTGHKGMGISLREEADALGLSPLAKLLHIHDKALAAFESGRGYGDKSDAGVGYLSIAAQVMLKLASLYYPSFTAIKAVNDNDSNGLPKEPIDSAKALLAVLNDPFARRAAGIAVAQIGVDKDPINGLPTGQSIDAMVDKLKDEA